MVVGVGKVTVEVAAIEGTDNMRDIPILLIWVAILAILLSRAEAINRVLGVFSALWFGALEAIT